MKVIHKFVGQYSPATSNVTFEIPEGANVLDMQVQGDELVLWAEVKTEPTPPLDNYVLRMVPTGASPPNSGLQYYKTIQVPNGLVFHFNNFL